jgi:hypothetical protein
MLLKLFHCLYMVGRILETNYDRRWLLLRLVAVTALMWETVSELLPHVCY